MVIDITKYMRELAKSNYFQILFSHKDNGIGLFTNKSNYTAVQVCFLNYLNYYNGLLMDISMKEVDKKVLNNSIYEDAYTYYKRMKDEKKKPLKYEEPEMKQSNNTLTTNFKWNFKSKKKDKNNGE